MYGYCKSIQIANLRREEQLKSNKRSGMLIIRPNENIYRERDNINLLHVVIKADVAYI